MKFNSIIKDVYRNAVPDLENGSNGGAGQPAKPESSAPPAVEPDDNGQDTIPEEMNLWDQLSREIDEPDDSDTEDSAVEDAPAEPDVDETPAPAEEPPEVETPAEAEPTAADTAVPTEPEVQPTEEPEPELPPQQTEEELQAAITQRRSEIEANLTERFGLSDDEALQLVTDPGKVFPKLQARMFTDMWLHVEAMINQKLPTVIETTTRTMKVREEKVNDFFSTWPQLDRKTHARQVAEVARVYSQIKPNATDEEITKHVGMQVMLMNGISPEMRSEEVTDPEPPVTPHRPAAVNGARAPQRSSGNIYEELSYDLDEDED